MKEHFYHTKKLPHFQPAEGTFFVTYRLFGSIPMEVVREMQAEFEKKKAAVSNNSKLSLAEKKQLLYDCQKWHFGQVDAFLDKAPNEPHWLKNKAVAKIVSESIHTCEARYFQLWCYCIMANHVHLLITLKPESPVLFQVLQNHKSFTGGVCNEFLGLEGKFWERESYDHLVRKNGEFERIMFYILNNPVKAKLVKNWWDWPSTYLHPDWHLYFQAPA